MTEKGNSLMLVTLDPDTKATNTSSLTVIIVGLSRTVGRKCERYVCVPNSECLWECARTNSQIEVRLVAVWQ